MSTSLTETTGSKGLGDSTPRSVLEAQQDTPVSLLGRPATSGAMRSRSALGRARRAWAPRPALRATVARSGSEHDRPYHAALRGSRPHTDHLGSTTTISESDGRVTGQSFDPFGAPVDPLNPAITRVGFTGQDQDVDLGLTDMKGRIYDPLGGRFTGVDPVMQAPFSSQGLNRYSYVFNDPINNTDPSGFSANGEDSTVGIAGWGAGVVAGAAITAFLAELRVGARRHRGVRCESRCGVPWRWTRGFGAGGRELFGDADGDAEGVGR